jgi:hypothetical protein
LRPRRRKQNARQTRQPERRVYDVHEKKCLLIGAILAAALAAQPEIPQYQVRQAASRIVVDGKAEDKASLDQVT